MILALAGPGWGASNWYVRPHRTAVYGSNNGTTYNDAWNGPTNIVWGGAGVLAGDTIWVCGIFGSAGSGWDSYSYAKMTVGTAGITIRGDADNAPDVNAHGHPCTWYNVSAREDSGHTWIDTGTNNVYHNNYWAGTIKSLWKSSDNIIFTQMNRDPVYNAAGAPNAVVLATFINNDWGIDTTSRYIYVKIADNSPTSYYWIGTYTTPNTGASITASGKDGLIIRDIIFRGSGLELTACDNLTIANLTFEENQRSICLLGQCDNVSVNNLTVSRSGSALYATRPVAINTNVTIDGFTITEIDKHGTPLIQSEPDYHAIAFDGGTGLVVKNGSVNNAATGVTIYNSDATSADMTVDNVFASDIWRLATGDSSPLTGHGCAFDRHGAGTNVTFIVRNSIATRVANCGVRVYSTGGTENYKVYNTTLDSCNIGICVYGYNSGAQLVDIRNNIVTNPLDYGAGLPICYVYAYNSNTLAANWLITCDYNNFYGIGSTDCMIFQDSAGGSRSVEIDLSTWQALIFSTGHPDTHSNLAAPLFLNAGGSYALATDFMLQATSPCKNAGTNVGLTTDYGGYRVPSGGYPIGAWEVQQGAWTPIYRDRRSRGR